MRSRAIRVAFLGAFVLVSSSVVTAAPRDRDAGLREDPPIVKIIKKLTRGIVTLGDSLIVPRP